MEKLLEVLTELESDLQDQITKEGPNSASLSRTLPLLNTIKSYQSLLDSPTSATKETVISQGITDLIDEVSLLGESYVPYVKGAFTNISGILDTPNTAKLITKENPNRCLLIIQNLSITPIYLEFGSMASPVRSLKIDIGETFKLDRVIDTREVYLVATKGNVPYTAVEVTKI